MNPKKSKEIVDITAKELNIDPNLVKDFTSFYWARLRKAFTQLEFPNVLIIGLGEMNIRPIKLKDFIHEHHRLKKYVNAKNYQGYHRMKAIDSRLERLINMELMLDIQTIKKDQFKIKKDEYKTNLEKQETDTRGDQE